MRGYTMEKDDYLKRLRRIEGQVRGIQRMIDEDAYCIDVLTQISAITKAISSVGIGLLEEHVNHCVMEAARNGDSMMEPSIECALARVTTGEWAGALREVFGEYRPSTGVDGQKLRLGGDRVDDLRARVGALAERLGHRPRIVVGKPGLDGHSNGAEVIAVSARHVGFDVIYSGIRLSPEEIVRSAVEEGADVIGASVLSGSHLELAQQVFEQLAAFGVDTAAGEGPVVVFGGIIPRADVDKLQSLGVERVFTPSDFELIDIMESIVDALEERLGRSDQTVAAS